MKYGAISLMVGCEKKNWISAPACAGVTILCRNDIVEK